MRVPALLLIVSALASCTTAPPGAPGADAAAKIQQMLAGTMAGGTSACIPEYQSSASSVIAPHAIAISPSPGLVYVTDTTGTGCEGVSGETLALVVKSHGPGGLCSGDSVEVRDVHTGMTVGSCLLHDFTQYHRS